MKNCLTRVSLVAGATAGEALRQRYFLVSGLIAAAVAAMSAGLRVLDVADGPSELKFTADIGFGALFFFGSLLSVVLPAHLFFSEMESRTALTLLARPLRRWEFLAGKLLGVWLLLSGLAVAVCAVTTCMIAWRHSELAAALAQEGASSPHFSLSGAAVFSLLQSLRLGVVASLTLFCCSYARSALFAYGAGFGWLIVGQTAWIGREWLWESGTGFWHRAASLLFGALPDLQAFNLAEALIFSGKPAAFQAAAGAALHGVLWILALVVMGSFAFKNREI